MDERGCLGKDSSVAWKRKRRWREDGEVTLKFRVREISSPSFGKEANASPEAALDIVGTGCRFERIA